MINEIKIDFVILWVDGEDEKWRKEYLEHLEGDDSTHVFRYRDWKLLPYWFRAVEKYAPWVNKIHFVTSGHFPDWLDLDNSKLNFVKHEDFIDKKYLPTFNSSSIELNMHKIKGLSEHFVYFNDDMYLTNDIKPEYFFKNGLPLDIAVSSVLSGQGNEYKMMNNLIIINDYFSKRLVFKKFILKFFNLNYGLDLLRNLILLPWPRFTGFKEPHQPQPYLKSIFNKVWNLENKKLSSSIENKFRHCSDLNQYLFRYWQLASGNFMPVSPKGKYLPLSDNTINLVEKALISKKYKTICLNDGIIEDFDTIQTKISLMFTEKLPIKSSFEL